MPDIGNQPGYVEGGTVMGGKMKPSHRASRYRQQIMEQVEQLKRLSSITQERSGILRASIYERKRKCGKDGCRCAQGRLHRGKVLEVRRNGKSHVKSLEGPEAGTITRLVESWRRFRRAKGEMVQSFGQLLKLVDRLGQLREVDFQKLHHPGLIT